MILTILLPMAIVLILALLYNIAAWYKKYDRKARQKYQAHIADLVQQLFPPDTIQTPTAQHVDQWREEAKDKMVADIRRYFNQRKVDAAIAKTPIPVHPSHEELTYPTPPSIQRMLE